MSDGSDDMSYGGTADNTTLLDSLDSFSLTSLVGDNNASSAHPPTINTGVASVPSQSGDNSLWIALGGDAAKVGSAFFVSQAAGKAATSPNAKYFVYGGVAIAAFALIYFMTRK